MAVPDRHTCLANATAAANRAQANAVDRGNPAWVQADAHLGQLWLGIADRLEDPINAEDAATWSAS